MDVPLRKVTARIDLSAGDSCFRPQPRSRPPSPTKQTSPSSFHPKVKNSNNSTIRKPSSTSSLTASRASTFAPVQSRPCSPLRPSWVSANGSEQSSSPKARVTTKPTSRPGTSPFQTSSASLEPRQRALTTASAKLKLPNPEDRPRSGSVITLHALSIPNLDTSFSAPSPPLSLAEPWEVDTRRINPPSVAPIKVKSKVTGLVKAASANAGDAASRSLSPPYATTRPIHARTRAPSITSSLSLNDPLPSTLYPITTAAPAANPYRYAPRRAPSPVRPHLSPALSGESHFAKKSPTPKVDPATVPLPPHSPPISTLSLSSKSSVSRTSTSQNSDQTVDSQASSVVAHVKSNSMERINQPNTFIPQSEIMTQSKRNRSRSKERSPHDHAHQMESDVEPDGPERQLEVEAKTNRKIADLEITNRSLLAINASLETTRNRHVKEIQDLRRKLRESRLILPPRTFNTVKSAIEDEDEDEDDSNVEEDADETFQRVRNLIDNLIESGKQALEVRPEDFRTGLTAKVLNADELRSWRDFGERTLVRNRYVDQQDVEPETIRSHQSPALVAVPGSGNTSSVQSDGGLASDSRLSSSLPPIMITHSS